MFLFTKWIAVPVLAVAFWAGGDTPQAKADHGFRMQLGRFGINIGGGHHGYYPSYSSPYGGHYGHRSYHPGHYGHRGYFHDTTHYDYHAPQIVPHGNHYDYQPGHYDLHRSGHWHH